jgi:hypothetical protein
VFAAIRPRTFGSGKRSKNRATGLTLTQSRISHEEAEKEHEGEQSEKPAHSLANQSRDG